jgi:hypothetical protein
MKKRITSKKLHLNKETLVDLYDISNEDLQNAAGGHTHRIACSFSDQGSCTTVFCC